MGGNRFDALFDNEAGLSLSWRPRRGLALAGALRVRVRGTSCFRVWSRVDSGEGPPLWAESDLDLTFFEGSTDGDFVLTRDVQWGRGSVRGRTLSCFHPRAEVVLDVEQEGGQLSLSFSITNPQPHGGRPLPLADVELSLAGLRLGPDAEYWSAHAYGGRTHGWGRLRDLDAEGVPFIHGCIGLAMPLVCLWEPAEQDGMLFEFMQEGRPTVWLCGGPDGAAWRQRWQPDRLLAPGQTHVFSGKLRLSGFRGRPVQAVRDWRDRATSECGLVTPSCPAWARRGSIIEFKTALKDSHHPFRRLDDPRVLELLRSWREMGYTVIFTVGHNNTGTHWLSPYDYDPSPETGGPAAERQYLEWAHGLGFKAFLWVTTVGIERRAPEVSAHPDWWTHRPDGSLFYAWDSHPPDYRGYAPDGDPLSSGWRAWLRAEVTKVIRRGYDGIFVDGCIPRASNHARWAWPGEARNGVADQVAELCAHVQSLGPGLAVFVEDQGLYAQCCAEVTCGRYYPVTPFFKKAHWDHGMGGGPEAAAAPPARIPPEMARDYLLLRYASMLPGAVSKEGHEGYYSEETRPWGVQSLMSGCVPKTHSVFVDQADTWRPMGEAPEPPEAEKAPEHRRRGHEEFVSLLRLCRDEPLIRGVPSSIEGVRVEGDPAVVGMISACPERAILTLIQFAGRPASVRVSLAPLVDVPVVSRELVGRPAGRSWRATELLHSMVESETAAKGFISARSRLRVELGPYSFRVFELVPRA